jgi:prepilin-type N-terminal cleavage/methylation domain-containing protein
MEAYMLERKGQSAFTLTELMIVVAIVGILASIAIPAFMRNARRAKTSEATVMVEKLSNGARAYFAEDHVAQGSTAALPAQYPVSQALTPATTCCSYPGFRCKDDPSVWSSAGWQALKFSLDDPHYFRFEFVSSGTGTDARFTARAYGDLDCDGVLSTFEMVGSVQADGTSTGQAGFYTDKILE